MKDDQTRALADPLAAVAFYEERYAHGYMEEWPRERCERIVEIVRALNLPAHGTALDFGCGSGALTGALREALPGWRIAGTDVSERAVANARRRHPDCKFFVQGEVVPVPERFDLVFSHHVLEHVADLRATFTEIDGLMKPQAHMLHLLPCGNPGSYEHQLCLLRKNGIQPELGNRFFFEDEAHVRRLTTQDLIEALTPFGYILRLAWYGNQRDAAIEWITASGPALVRLMADPEEAVDADSARKLREIRRILLPLAFLRGFVQRTRALQKKSPCNWRDRLALAWRLPIFRLIEPVDQRVRARAMKEPYCDDEASFAFCSFASSATAVGMWLRGV